MKMEEIENDGKGNEARGRDEKQGMKWEGKGFVKKGGKEI